MPFLEIIFGLLSMLGFGLSNSLAKKPAGKIGPIKVIVFRNIFTVLLLFLLFIFFSEKADFSLQFIAVAFLIALIGFVPLALFYRALEVGKLGIVAPIANSSAIFTVLFASIFLGERLSLLQFAGILAVIAGIAMMSLNFNDLKKSVLFERSSGIWLALATSVLWGLVFFLFKYPVTVLGAVLSSLIIEFGVLAAGVSYLALQRKDFLLPEKKILPSIFFVALFAVSGLVFFNFGIKTGLVGIVATISSANPLVSAIYGKIFLKEKISKQQYTAMLAIFAGIVLLLFFD